MFFLETKIPGHMEFEMASHGLPEHVHKCTNEEIWGGE